MESFKSEPEGLKATYERFGYADQDQVWATVCKSSIIMVCLPYAYRTECLSAKDRTVASRAPR